MNSLEKAKELANKFKGSTDVIIPNQSSIKFAKICVQEIINSNPHSNPLNTQVDSTMGYWQEVLNHLNENVIMERITPENITKLKDNEVFVFGSNKSGKHGKGAAKTALGWGAKYGQASGIQGKTYGIPTKDHSVKRTLSIEEIKPYVDDFINWATYHTGNTFLVTEIGCGLAGLRPKDIAPLFVKAKDIENIYLPNRFWRYL